ncbi:alginate export family protein [Catenovulum adriaticum]|uniref:Alginate export family protein n=1 Tax=Catenovulum adriaticum TaxID=2984846 RepID=A0ABY7AS16_9ALTE|nr:alginate export family protein [Catenovulum sp. TS8]WAJ72053.1 alginate export family protein [Catenovulum sp. TS8]
MQHTKSKIAFAIVSILSTGAVSVPSFAAESFSDAFKQGKAFGDFRLRYEDAETGDLDGSALTLRTRLGFKTASVSGFSGLIEFEDNRQVLGQDEYKTTLAGVVNEYAEISDPEFTELDQAYIAYAANGLTAKLGRQVLTLDGHRHVGHVGWRQDRQTFDALNLVYGAGDFSANLAYVYKHNRIFGETKDVEADTVLVNLSYNTTLGKAVAYSYKIAPEATQEMNTYGVSFGGKTASDIPFLYSAEYALQDNKTLNVDTHYIAIEAGAIVNGVTLKLGQETLGSDNGQGHFATPLATLHKFNGFADVFLGSTFNSPANGMGLVDTYASVSTKISGIGLTAIYHDFKTDEGSADLGNELNLVAATQFGAIKTGIKYAAFSSDTIAVADTDRLWLWLQTGF